MKIHSLVMLALMIFGAVLILIAPNLGIGRGLGLLLFICPLMMLAMMGLMGNNHKH